MRKETKPFELVTHIDEDGTRATACYRTRIFDDAGVLVPGSTTIEGVTLAELGDKFPWKEFADAALQGALLTIERHEATISAKEGEKTVALAAKDAEIAKKVAELAAKTEEHAAEKAARKAKEQKVTQLAAQVKAQDAELTVLKMPAEEKRKAGIRAEIERLQASLELVAGETA